MEIKKIIKILLIVSICLIVVDQASKILIEKFAPDSCVVLTNVLEITKVENEGIAFGINKNNASNIALVLLILVIAVRFVITQRKFLTPKTVVFVSLMIAGGISNLIDRIARGSVFDFIKVGDFPVFNLADCFIVIGWILFVIDILKNLRMMQIEEKLKK